MREQFLNRSGILSCSFAIFAPRKYRVNEKANTTHIIIYTNTSDDYGTGG